ncbi:Hypothetical predicted protein [Pelobates cultripes]|uniref:Uncharacterized protein n=1 Tax=Pelobates cultripes TaxID=61616 RepID=A0AAD1RA43_PELCU|nr:Hypothetical predicted protein [Pelobates cultripes]
MKLQALTTLIPQFNAKEWANYGITSLHQIVDNNKLIPFAHLQAKLKVPKPLNFMYIQIQSWFRKHYPPNTTLRQDWQLSPLEQLCIQSKPPPKLISQLYNIIIQRLYTAKPSFISAWERDLQKKLEESQ